MSMLSEAQYASPATSWTTILPCTSRGKGLGSVSGSKGLGPSGDDVAEEKQED